MEKELMIEERVVEVAELTEAELEAVSGGYWDTLTVVNVNDNANFNVNDIDLTLVLFS